MIIERSIRELTQKYGEIFPVIGIIGPRQTGKTTFVKYFIKSISKPCIYLDLEKLSDQDKLLNPEIYFSEYYDHCIILDEIQLMPQLFPLIRSLVDQDRQPLRFIILGSARPDIIRKSSETLAGRIGYIELYPFNFSELNGESYDLTKHYFFGGFPPSYLAINDDQSSYWLDNFIKTYIEREFPMLGLSANSMLVRRLWEMLAWQSGNLLNYSSIGKSLGISNHTVNNYIDFLEGAFMVKRLSPYHFNIKKRLVKTSKVYLTDTGILHRLLRISNYDQLYGSPFLGSSWETFVINQIVALKPHDIELFFYRTHAGAEVDLVFVRGLQPVAAIEIKYASTIKVSRGFNESIQDLNTNNNFIITKNSDEYPASNNIKVCSLQTFLQKYIPQF